MSDVKQFSAGKFTAACAVKDYPVDVLIGWNGGLLATLRHDELADLLHVLHRMQAHLRHHPVLKDRWHEVD